MHPKNYVFYPFTLFALVVFMVGCGDDNDPVGPASDPTGTIAISITPDQLDAGWALSGPDKATVTGSGSTTHSEMPAGEYTVSWGNVAEYVTPTSTPQILAADGTITFSGAYGEIVQSGTIIVDQIPDDLDDAHWLLLGPQNKTGSGDAVLTAMPIGEYTLTWSEVEFYTSAASSTINLTVDSEITFTGVYEEIIQFGTIAINQNPEFLSGAGWSLTGPQSKMGFGDEVLTEMALGEYVLTWEAVDGYFRPSSCPLTLGSEGEIFFHGTYMDDLGLTERFVSIPPVSESMPVTFTMGSMVASGETPHEVTLTERFTMSSSEVTNEQYIAALHWALKHGYITVGSNRIRDAVDGSTILLLNLYAYGNEIHYDGTGFVTSFPNHPVGRVTWYGAAAYCDWLSLQNGLPRAYDHSTWRCNDGEPYVAVGYRLPTEAEWEFACRAGTNTVFYTGDCLDSATDANFNGEEPFEDCSPGPYEYGVLDVGSYPCNSWHLFDMHGNVFEWCNDQAGTYTSAETNPTGDSHNFRRVIRGGGTGFWAFHCRSAARMALDPDFQYSTSGFRPVISARP